MKQLKKTILTLVALLAVTTGAWAQTETLLTTITATGTDSYSETTPGVVTVTHDNDKFDVDWGWIWRYQPGSITVEAKEGYTITRCVFSQPYKTPVTVSTAPFKVNFLYNDNEDYEKYLCVGTDPDEGIDGFTSIEVYGYKSASSGPEVAWNKAENSGTFTMPGGNVTLEPEYYDLATAAEGAVTAADADARATTDDPLVKVDATKLTGAKKLMYFVSNSGTTAPAYDAEGWTDQLPNAEGFTQQGIVYVWYYPVGTDEGVDGATATYSDGDICLQSITARIAAAPTYAVTFAEGTDPNEWTADPNADVKKGQTVTVTYSGTKKVIGVKAEKKAAPAAAEGHALSASAVGEIVGTDGKAYAVADKDNLPEGVTAVAMVAYKSATAGSSLAIALADQGSMRWSTAKSQCAGKTAIGGKSWKLPSQGEWKQMFSANGDNEGQYTGLNTAITNAGGTALASTLYWSSSSAPAPDDDYDERAWAVNLGGGGASWESTDPAYYKQVRACLAF